MEFLFPLIAVFAPLLASGLTVLLGTSFREKSSSIGITALSLSTAASVISLYRIVQGEPLLLRLGVFLPGPIQYTLLIDRLSSVMMVLITGVSLVIHVYSQRYMRGDQGYVRFFCLLSFLTFVLLSLVTSGNLFWLFLFWHLVTWLLVFLVSFNQASAAARAAGRTTWWVQAIGDVALLLGGLLAYVEFGTLDLMELFRAVQSTDPPRLWTGTMLEMNWVTLVTLLILISIMTKSAQFPFHVWLQGTIEAPTPVSAMLHAGIVNAGGFLVNRLAPLYGLAPMSLYLMFFIGGLTALIGASTMLAQSSIKRTLVYSTMGQMGYMIMECGLGAFALAVFHLCAHGLFKAALFLNSGANIQNARTELTVPRQTRVVEASGFSLVTWATGLGGTLMLPLLILLVAHGLVNVPLFEAQGTLIFLFFAWVTSAQAIFSLYRLNAVASWKVSLTMVATLTLIVLTYLWAGESFTHFLYPEQGVAASYFQAASWPKGLFDAFVALAALLIIAVWILLYGKAHGLPLVIPAWLGAILTRVYVAFLNGLYVDEVLRTLGGKRGRIPAAGHRTTHP